jgi:hypothetical protein
MAVALSLWLDARLTALGPSDAPLLRDAWGSSPSDLYAVGPQVLLHYDGSSWSKISEEGGDRVWGTSQNHIFILRTNEILHLHR